MKLIETSGWEDFQRKLEKIREVEKSKGHATEFLFRGAADSAWPLKTTLERAGWEDVSISRYYDLIFGLKPQVESYTSRKWETSPPQEIQKMLGDFDTWRRCEFPTPEIYSYMIYLRHHGFPSPLLDWTRSPHVAAFFAFRSALRPSDENVSIFAFSEMPESFHVCGNSDPCVRRTGEHVSTHRRHFLQQSDYTMCAIFKSGPWQFANHETVFSQNNEKQDILWKFNIPWAERTKILKELDAYNLNASSLFESEESLMETLAFRTLEAGQLG